MFDVKIIADSITEQQHRLTTMEVVMPRIVLAEFNTHRMLSRNSASSRAIPFKKMVKMVQDNPFVPIKWMKEHTGMQGIEYFGDRETFTSTNTHDKNAKGYDADDSGYGPGGTRIIVDVLKENWLYLRDIAIQKAQVLNNAGVLYNPDGDTSKLTGEGRGLTKQMCNRLLESWMYHKVLVSATEWENFFALRHHEAAEIHIQKIAEMMLEAMNGNTPKLLKAGEWHIPYGDQLNKEQLLREMKYNSTLSNIASEDEMFEYYALRIATARCAQVSYTVIDAEEKPMDYAKLIALHDRLAASGHWSPFEHCARAMTDEEYETFIKGEIDTGFDISHDVQGWCGNYRGFIQYRKLFDNENRKDERLLRKEIN